MFGNITVVTRYFKIKNIVIYKHDYTDIAQQIMIIVHVIIFIVYGLNSKVSSLRK